MYVKLFLKIAQKVCYCIYMHKPLTPPNPPTPHHHINNRILAGQYTWTKIARRVKQKYFMSLNISEVYGREVTDDAKQMHVHTSERRCSEHSADVRSFAVSVSHAVWQKHPRAHVFS